MTEKETDIADRGLARKKTWDPDVVRVTGQLELAPNPAEPTLSSLPPRSRKYIPPVDLVQRLELCVREVFGPSSNWQQVTLEDSSRKFHLLAGLAAELGHAVPNSRLREMQNTRDLLTFYSTPVKEVSKFDELIAADLPSNLKIDWGYKEL
ncbi:large ribosomal subunit protein mL50 [Ambystoma mexicanum]|uniref:large ribosomal subunit protein mL50 n=1 Tax=Ambystoma mexicanum TaxID=8296 RepID=UPI0037E82640